MMASCWGETWLH